MILLRTTSFSDQTAAFARRLSTETGHRVACVVDERKRAVEVGAFDKISLTLPACRELGLYCPRDVGWRCGDYGFYLARDRYPDERFFWLFEYDVRLSGPDFAPFFQRFDGADDVDLLACNYREAGRWWYWTHTMIALGQPTVWRCLFPVVRLSAPAIDLLLEQRRAYARHLGRLANWPNDESFCATILTRAGRKVADLNTFGEPLYDETTFTYGKPIDGHALDLNAGPLRIYHPVLFDDDLRRKVKHMVWVDKGESLPRKVKRRLLNAWNVRSLV